jgi:hypothetical protein
VCSRQTWRSRGLRGDLVSEKYLHDESRDMPLTLSDCDRRVGADELDCSNRRRPVANLFQQMN